MSDTAAVFPITNQTSVSMYDSWVPPFCFENSRKKYPEESSFQELIKNGRIRWWCLFFGFLLKAK